MGSDMGRLGMERKSAHKRPQGLPPLLMQASGRRTPGREQGPGGQAAQDLGACCRHSAWRPSMELCSVTDGRAPVHADIHRVTKPRSPLDFFPSLFPLSLKARPKPSFLDLQGKYVINCIRKCQSWKGHKIPLPLNSHLNDKRLRCRDVN